MVSGPDSSTPTGKLQFFAKMRFAPGKAVNPSRQRFHSFMRLRKEGAITRRRVYLLCMLVGFVLYIRSASDEADRESLLCSIGEPFERTWLRDQLTEFQRVYDRRPVAHSASGSNLFHAFAQWCIIRHLRPQFIIESGVMLGWGTYMLRQAAGNSTHIIAISPDSPAKVATQRRQKYYIDGGKVSYLCDAKFQDFNTVDWSMFGLKNKADFSAALVYFDDHQSGYRRLIEAHRAGFVHIMYDDGYPWPGDNYALKQTCDVDGRILKLKPGASPAPSKLFPYHDDFSNLKTTITLSEKKCMYADFVRRVEIYYEFPPLWKGDFRGVHVKMMEFATQKGLLEANEAHAFLAQFQKLKLNYFEEAARYTFFTYVKLTIAPPTDPAGCLKNKPLQPKYQVVQ